MPQTKEEISQALIYYKNIVNTVREALIILDEELKVVSANDAFYRLFHVSKEETEGRHIYELGSRQWDLDGLKEILEKIIPRNDHFQDYMADYTFPIIGHKIMLLNGRRVIHGERGHRLILLAIEDVTERIAEQRSIEKYTAMLEDANTQLRTFDYTISHDLRAPLNIITSYATIMLQEHAGQLDEDGKRILSVIRSKVQDMENLIRDLLRFSHISVGEIHATSINMDKIVGSVIAEIRASLPSSRKVQITTGQLSPAQGDPAMIRQVWVNLVDNAVKFTRPRQKAVIDIGGQSDAKENVYFIRDNGIGFDMKHAKKLFGIFQRLHSSKEYGGTGAGLAIVRRIIVRHGGRVWAESKENEGATFYFTLPKEGGINGENHTNIDE